MSEHEDSPRVDAAVEESEKVEAAGEAADEAAGEAAGDAAGEATGEATGEAAGEATGEAAGEAENSDMAPKPKPTRVAKPDYNAFKEEEAVIQADIDATHEKMNKIKAELENKDSASQDIVAQRDKEQEVLRGIHKQQKALQAERREILSKIELVREANKAKNAALDTLKRQLGKYNTTAKVESRIAELESAISTSAGSLRDERELVQQISALKRNRGAVVEYEALVADATEIKSALDPLYDSLRAKEVEIKEVKAAESEQRAAVDVIRARVKDTRSNTPGLWKKRKELKSQLDKLYNARRELRNNYGAQKRAFGKYMKAMKEWKAHDYKARKAAREAEAAKEAEVEAAARAEDERDIIPYIAEMKTCASLVAYLEAALASAGQAQPAVNTKAMIFGEDAPVPGLDAPKEPAALPKLPKRRQVSNDLPKGAKRMGKRIGKGAGDDDEVLDRNAVRKNKKNGKKNKKNKKKSMFVMAPHVIADFAKVGLTAPLEISGAAPAIDALVSRIEDYKAGNPPKVAKPQTKAGKKKSGSGSASTSASAPDGPPGFDAPQRAPAPVDPAPIPTTAGGFSYATAASGSV